MQRVGHPIGFDSPAILARKGVRVSSLLVKAAIYCGVIAVAAPAKRILINRHDRFRFT